MAKISLICLYDDWATGLRIIANALVDNHHEVSIIHFKLPSSHVSDRYLNAALNYQVINSSLCDTDIAIKQFHVDSNKWIGNELKLLGDLLVDESPDMIGLSTRGVYEDNINDIIDQMKKVPTAITVCGGMGPTANPHFYAGKVDYVCLAEGEETILEMAKVIDTDPVKSMDHIVNLACVKNGVFKSHEIKAPDNNIDYFFSKQSDLIKHHVIEENRLLRGVHPLMKDVHYTMHCGYPNYYTMLGRGCVYQCSYCMASIYAELYTNHGQCINKRRNRRIGDLIEELVWAKEQGCRIVYFNDSFLVGSTRYVAEFFDEYKREVALPFFAYLFPDMILRNEKILDKACDAGLSLTAMGIQSGSQRIHEEIFGRKFSAEKTLRVASLLVGKNLKVNYHFITHNPFETIDDFNDTLSLISRLPKENTVLQLMRLNPFRGSRINDMIEGRNICIDDMDEFDKRAALSLYRYKLQDDDMFDHIRVISKTTDFIGLKEYFYQACVA